MSRYLAFALLGSSLLVGVPAGAQVVPGTGAEGTPPQRIRNVQLTGSEKCPVAQADEIVVCNRLEEPYRIPKSLRDQAIAPANQAWTNRVVTAEQVSREASGLPDTCSPVGTGGQTGCALKLNNIYAAEKRAAEKNDAAVP